MPHLSRASDRKERHEPALSKAGAKADCPGKPGRHHLARVSADSEQGASGRPRTVFGLTAPAGCGDARDVSTEDHLAPARTPSPLGAPGLAVVFPSTAALPLPARGLALGHALLAEAGAPDRKISRQHAELTRRGPRAYLTDVGSRNGTWVDGQRLSTHERVTLEDGAVIRAGRTLLVYREQLGAPRGPGWPDELATTFGLTAVAREVEALAVRPEPAVLIRGETGTGKEALSRLVAARLRPGRAVVAVNVAGIPDGVFEAQLFGHERGAFTGAGQSAVGVLEAHDGGSVILDELGELPLALQAKLLRTIENREVQPIGAQRPRSVDVLLIAATQRELDAEVEAGRFRADLLARFPARLELPPLRDRREDVFAVVQRLAAGRGEHYDPDQVDVEALERLMLEPWPTNVRGLYLTLQSVARLTPPPQLRLADVERVLGPPALRPPLSRQTALDAITAHGSKSAAARALGVSRGALYRALEEPSSRDEPH